MANLLNKLQSQLSNARIESGPNFPHLIVPIGSNSIVMAQTSAAQQSLGQQSDNPTIDYLQMYVKLPFQLNPNNLPETTMLMSYINAQLPLLGFVVGADGQTLAFRYLHLINPQDPQMQLVKEAIETVQFLVDTFAATIGSVASGQLSFGDAIDQING